VAEGVNARFVPAAARILVMLAELADRWAMPSSRPAGAEGLGHHALTSGPHYSRPGRRPEEAIHVASGGQVGGALCAVPAPGSQIRQVFIGQHAPSRWFFLVTYLTGLTMFWIKYRCVAVTQDAIYVLESSRPSGGGKPTSLVGTLPRQTQLGPVSGRWDQVNLLGERYWVHKRFHQAVTAADDEAGFTRSTTPRVSSGPSR
jgi:hypothetical protein